MRLAAENALSKKHTHCYVSKPSTIRVNSHHCQSHNRLKSAKSALNKEPNYFPPNIRQFDNWTRLLPIQAIQGNMIFVQLCSLHGQNDGRWASGRGWSKLNPSWTAESDCLVGVPSLTAKLDCRVRNVDIRSYAGGFAMTERCNTQWYILLIALYVTSGMNIRNEDQEWP